MYQVDMSEATIKNARTFLMRIELKATEIDAFVDVLTSLRNAKPAVVEKPGQGKPKEKSKKK